MTDRPPTQLPWDRYIESIAADTDRLATVAAEVLDAPVPACPGWDVRDLLSHVGYVYLHKVGSIRTGARPDPWPPADVDDSDPVRFVRDSCDVLLDTLRTADPDAEGWTWNDEDQTHGFWFRRMAQEVAIHRVDGEQAHAVANGQASVTAIDEDIAVDGIDEFLHLFVGGSWADEQVEHPVGATVAVSAGGRSWTLWVDAAHVGVARGTETADVWVSGAADAVYLWLWGRAPLDALALDGNRQVAENLRARFAQASN